MASTQRVDKPLSTLRSTNAAVPHQQQPWAHPYQGRPFPLAKESGTGLRGTPGLGRGSSQQQRCSGVFTAAQLVLLGDGQHQAKGRRYLQAKDEPLES